MKINIITIGSFKNKDPYSDLFFEYKKRIKYNINLIELKTKQCNSTKEQKNYEGELLLKARNPQNKLIVLDEKGEIITTTNFETLFTTYELIGGIDFIIGGSDGLSEIVKNKADFILSFGKMVFPHLMIRVMLIEQIYRVYTLKNNHPYHK